MHACPHCGASVSHEAFQRAVSRIGTAAFLPHRDRYGAWMWACATCLDSGRVRITDPSGHDHLPTMGPTRQYLFWDREKTCKVCKAPFVFSAREQQRWYDDFRIPIEVDRVRCDGCQRRRRAEQTINSRMPGASPDSIYDAVALADAYGALGAEQKQRRWQKRVDALVAEGHRLPPERPTKAEQHTDKSALRARLRERKRARKRAQRGDDT